MVSKGDGGTVHHLSRGAPGEDSRSRTAPPKTRSPRCPLVARPAEPRSLSVDLDACDRAPGSACLVTAPRSVGSVADPGDERAARHRVGPWDATRVSFVE